MFRTATSCAAVLLAFSLASPIQADEPLHLNIDRLIAAGAGDFSSAPPADDAEFLRRIYLDLAGRIPTAEEAKAFLDSSATNKRKELIEQLLAGPDYPRHLSEQLHIMFMERLSTDPAWTRFLRTSIEKNLPWDKIAHAMLHPDRDDEDSRGAAFFLTSRLISEGAMAATDVPGLTRDVGRMLVGKDLQCAQCHDDLAVDDYKQHDFQGLHAIFLNVKQDRGADYPAVSEGLMTAKHEFMSVFIQEPTETGPVIPGKGEIEVPTFAKGEEYLIEPDRKQKIVGVPKFSPLKELADGLASADNELFRCNMANRLWFLMLGRGLVHPPDAHHSDNPPSHPELLDLLGKEFADSGFDIKHLLREIALSETYQRSSLLTEGQPPAPRDRFLVAHQKRISPEQLAMSTLVATGELETYQNNGEDFGKLREQFVKMFANPPREPELEFTPSVKGTLFALNSSQALRLFEPRTGNLAERLSKLPEEKIAEELFLSILTRHPTEEDRADVAQFLKESEDRETALGQLAWALWSSNEFFINH